MFIDKYSSNSIKNDDNHHIIDIRDSDYGWFVQEITYTNSIGINNDYESDDDAEDTDIHKRLPEPIACVFGLVLYVYIVYFIISLYH